MKTSYSSLPVAYSYSSSASYQKRDENISWKYPQGTDPACNTAVVTASTASGERGRTRNSEGNESSSSSYADAIGWSMTAESTDMLGISRKFIKVSTEFKTYSIAVPFASQTRGESFMSSIEDVQNWTTRAGDTTARSRVCRTVDLDDFPFTKVECDPWVQYNTTYESRWFSSSYATTSENEVKWRLGTSTYEKLTTTKYGSLWLDTSDTWVETDTDLIPYSTEIKTTTDTVKAMGENGSSVDTITKVARISESFIPTYTFKRNIFIQ